VKYSILIKITGAICLYLLWGCKAQQVYNLETKAPNIVYILVDDLGAHDLGYTGSTFYHTPNIDRLSREAMNFTNGYAASRVCSPSRASIMLGKYTARHGITDWIGAKTGTEWRKRNRNNKLLPADYTTSLPHEDITIAEAMKTAGYKTFFAGKWHLGDKGSYPEDHGFDINKGGFHRGGPPGGFFSPWQNPKLKSKTKGENLTLRLAEETTKFIKKHRDTTFFAFLSFYAVHAPLQTTEARWQKFRDKAETQGIADKGYVMERNLPIRQVQDNPIYAGLLETVDDAVGLVLKTIEDAGIAENTIIVFTSDNGGVASGDHYATSNLPLRGGKGYQWEGGLRVPYLIKVPWLETEDKTTNYAVNGTDFYPTLLDLANIPLKRTQHVDGVSLKPLLEGKHMKQERPMFWHYPHYGNQGGEPASILQENNRKYIYYWEDGREELYNLPSPESDNLNIIKQEPLAAERMRLKLFSWLKQVEAKQPTPDTTYNSARAKVMKTNIVSKKLPSLEKKRKQMLSKDFMPNVDWWKSKQKK
jgi:arylsulfatase A-like enzyme